jgi:hypothetical protein
MSPDAVPRIDYLRWKFGFRASHWLQGYDLLDCPRSPGYTVRPCKPGYSEARAIRKRLCCGRPVSRRLARWAFKELADMERDYARYLMFD